MRHTYTHRRQFCRSLLGAIPVFCLSPPAWAQQLPAKPPTADMITPATRTAIERGLAYLAEQQNDDGSFGRGGYSRNVGVVGLIGLAFLAHGDTPGRGPYGRQVDKLVDYLMDKTQDSGLVYAAGSSSHGPMYGHGFATLFLSQVHGMSTHPDLPDKLRRAVQLIVATQNDEGGWRYQPETSDADLSVTVCQIMALRAARNAGYFVPNKTVDTCIDYVQRCQNPDGGFRYMLTGGSQSLFPRSAAGIVALYSAGIYDGDEVTRGLEYLMGYLPKQRTPQPAQRAGGHFFYGHYYAALAMWHADGERWRKWYPAIRGLLLARQNRDGFWIDAICPEYGTAMATIILQLPNNTLPIFQR